MAHVLDALPNPIGSEQVLQGRKARIPVGSADYRRSTIINLAEQGHELNAIALMAGLTPADVQAVLGEVAA